MSIVRFVPVDSMVRLGQSLRHAVVLLKDDEAKGGAVLAGLLPPWSVHVLDRSEVAEVRAQVIIADTLLDRANEKAVLTPPSAATTATAAVRLGSASTTALPGLWVGLGHTQFRTVYNVLCYGERGEHALWGGVFAKPVSGY